MNKKNSWLDVILLGLFILTGVSAFGAGAWETVHNVAGLLMLIGGLMHIACHWGYIKVAVIRAPKNPRKRVRIIRLSHIALLIIFSVCSMTGLMASLTTEITSGSLLLAQGTWSDLHWLTGVLMFPIMLVHLALYWKRMTSAARRHLQTSADEQQIADQHV